MAENQWANTGPMLAGSTRAMPVFRPQGDPYTTGSVPGFYDPGRSYGADRQWATTPIISGPSGYLENDWNALYTRFIAPWAVGESPFARWVRGQQGEVQDAFRAAIASNPMLTGQQFLEQLGPQSFSSQWFGNLTPAQRGQHNANYGGGRLTWL